MVGEIMFSKKFKKIGLKIAYYRKRKALKQMEVAEKAGIRSEERRVGKECRSPI